MTTTKSVHDRARELEAKLFAAGQSTAARVAVLEEALRGMTVGQAFVKLEGIHDAIAVYNRRWSRVLTIADVVEGELGQELATLARAALSSQGERTTSGAQGVLLRGEVGAGGSNPPAPAGLLYERAVQPLQALLLEVDALGASFERLTILDASARASRAAIGNEAKRLVTILRGESATSADAKTSGEKAAVAEQSAASAPSLTSTAGRIHPAPAQGPEEAGSSNGATVGDLDAKLAASAQRTPEGWAFNCPRCDLPLRVGRNGSEAPTEDEECFDCSRLQGEQCSYHALRGSEARPAAGPPLPCGDDEEEREVINGMFEERTNNASGMPGLIDDVIKYVRDARYEVRVSEATARSELERRANLAEARLDRLGGILGNIDHATMHHAAERAQADSKAWRDRSKAPVSQQSEEVVRLRAEIDMLRGVDCEADGDGPCGACLKCARAGVGQPAATPVDKDGCTLQLGDVVQHFDGPERYRIDSFDPPVPKVRYAQVSWLHPEKGAIRQCGGVSLDHVTFRERGGPDAPPAPVVDLTRVCWQCKAEQPESSLRHMVGVGYTCVDAVGCRSRRDYPPTAEHDASDSGGAK